MNGNEEIISTNWIAGFWKRVFAFFIDVFLLGILGFIIGNIFSEFFVSLGSFGRIFGFIIALIYFGVLNSNISNGQTIGKKILSIKVVNSENGAISTGKSFLRFSIVGIPYFLNGMILPNYFLSFPLLNINALIVFGGLFSIVYLFLFNKATRQSLHDLFIGTFVVNSSVDVSEIKPIWKPHIIIVAFVCTATFLGSIFFSNLSKEEPFSNLLEIQNELINNSSVNYATIKTGEKTLTTFNESSSSSYLSIQIFLIENKIDDEEFARSIASKVVELNPSILDKDVLQVTLVYGFDIGIATQWVRNNYNYDPIDFQSALVQYIQLLKLTASLSLAKVAKHSVFSYM